MKKEPIILFIFYCQIEGSSCIDHSLIIIYKKGRNKERQKMERQIKEVKQTCFYVQDHFKVTHGFDDLLVEIKSSFAQLYCFGDPKIKYTMMTTRKKHSSISEPTQPERSRRFIRRNSVHTLHCREGSLNKMTSFSQELGNRPEVLAEVLAEGTCKRQETNDVVTKEIMSEFEVSLELGQKRTSGSMQVKSCCRDQVKLAEQFALLKQKYDQRGQQLQQLEKQCRKLKFSRNEEHSKRKKLEQNLKQNQQQLKRINNETDIQQNIDLMDLLQRFQKRIERSKHQREQQHKERELMVQHIATLETTSFSQSLQTMQSYKEQILENQLKTVRETLARDRSRREQELEGSLQKLVEQKYTSEVLHSRVVTAKEMLSKQLAESQQCLEEMRRGMTQKVTASVEYIELRDRYRGSLIQMRELRREIVQLETERKDGSSILSISMLSAVEKSMIDEE